MAPTIERYSFWYSAISRRRARSADSTGTINTLAIIRGWCAQSLCFCWGGIKAAIKSLAHPGVRGEMRFQLVRPAPPCLGVSLRFFFLGDIVADVWNTRVDLERALRRRRA